MNFKISIAFIFLSLSISAFTQENECSIIPRPNNIEFKTGKFVFENKLAINNPNNEMDQFINSYKKFLNDFSDTKIMFADGKGFPSIQVIHNESKNLGKEEYKLEIEPSKITVTASYGAGLFYGLMSVTQLILFAEKENGKNYIPCFKFKDSPRYAWRGLMLDESRHFMGKEKVKQLLDYMALHKLNKFHWHLTDVPGWRIEIKKYPKLTSVGAIGNQHDPDAEAKFYTQEDVLEIIKYAGDRFIEVIPEIDMPGHATAANRAYPEFSGGGSERHPEFTFHPGKEGTYQFLTNILKEVSSLFPSEYIHIGGDEVHFGNHQWKTDPEVRALMKAENLNNLVEVEQYFVRRMADSISLLGKKVAGWDEVMGAGLDRNSALIMWWRHDKPYLLTDAIAKNYHVVMCPRIPLYLDFVQHGSHEHGRRWGGEFCDIEKVYMFPGSDIDGDNKNITGIQANIWTATIHNHKRLEFMTFPRLSAMSEAAWSDDENKNYQGFMARLRKMLMVYERDNIYYFNPFEPGKTPEPKGITN